MTETWPAGHYYSPIPDLDEIRARQGEIFDDIPDSIPGIDLRPEAQMAFVAELAAFVDEFPYGPGQDRALRYTPKNNFYGLADGLILYCMLRRLRPRRYVEIGSGWSSALTLDVRDRFLGGHLEATFVDPYPERLDALFTEADHNSATILRKPLHVVWRDAVAMIDTGDFLMIDSSHVGKIGSDVLIEIGEMIPSLPPGVHVHLHDIFYPFEYPKEWVFEGRFWNEAYLLRALLTGN